MNLNDAAKQSGISRSTLKMWAQQGLIKGAWKAGPRLWLLPDDWKPPKTKRGPRFMKDRK